MSPLRRSPADESHLVVRTTTFDARAGGEVAVHTHDWHQLVHVRRGLVVVRTDAGTWPAPPERAVWVPAGVRHALRFVGASTLRTAYLRADWRDDLPGEAGTVAVSPLLGELLVRATEIGMLDRRIPSEAAVAELIAGELAEVQPPTITLPEPRGTLTRQAAQLLLDGAPGVPAVAAALGTGRRTLERRFRDETGMPLARWHQHRRLLTGLEQIVDGATVVAAADTAGYRSASAYVAAFRAAFGTTPGRWTAAP